MEQETGQATQHLIEIVYRELDARRLSGSVRLDVPISTLIMFLEEHGLDVPEANRPDYEQRRKNKEKAMRATFQTGDIVERTDGHGARYRIMDLSDKDPRWALVHQIAENDELDPHEQDHTADLDAFHVANQ